MQPVVIAFYWNCRIALVCRTQAQLLSAAVASFIVYSREEKWLTSKNCMLTKLKPEKNSKKDFRITENQRIMSSLVIAGLAVSSDALQPIGGLDTGTYSTFGRRRGKATCNEFQGLPCTSEASYILSVFMVITVACKLNF